MAFESLDSAKIMKRGIHLSTKKGTRDPNEFLCEILTVEKHGRWQKPDMVTVTYKVLETTDPEQHPIGAERITQQDLGKDEYAGPNLAEFVCAVLGVDPQNAEAVKGLQSGGKLAKAMTLATEQNAFVGKKVRVIKRPHKTRPKALPNGTIQDGILIDLSGFRPA